MPLKDKNKLYENLKTLGAKLGFTLLTPNWINSHFNYKWLCSNGHQFSRLITHIKYRQSPCPECSGFIISIKDCHELAILRGGECLSDEYINNTIKLKWRCQLGHEWLATWNAVKSANAWCSKCAGNKRHDINDCHELALKNKGRCLSTEYKNNMTKMLWECHKKHKFWATFNSINNYDSWCPYCVYFISKPETAIFNFIYSLYPDTVSNKTKILINPKFRIDIYIPSLRKAIEFDGTYWHSTEIAKERDFRKNQECEQLGIKLLRIPEAEYTKNPELIKEQILKFLQK